MTWVRRLMNQREQAHLRWQVLNRRIVEMKIRSIGIGHLDGLQNTK